jgi:hypothetical protein
VENRFEPAFGHGPAARATFYFLLRYPGEVNANAKEYTADRCDDCWSGTADTVGRRLGDDDTACKDAEKVMVDRHNAGQAPLASDVLVAPHHGGNNGSSACFIQAVAPQFVVSLRVAISNTRRRVRPIA